MHDATEMLTRVTTPSDCRTDKETNKQGKRQLKVKSRHAAPQHTAQNTCFSRFPQSLLVPYVCEWTGADRCLWGNFGSSQSDTAHS
jgi:hypothetical protein